LERNFGDDDAVAPAFLDEFGLAAHEDRAAAGAVRLPDRLFPHQEAAGREIGTLHDVG